jgi:hypothetical protein
MGLLYLYLCLAGAGAVTLAMTTTACPSSADVKNNWSNTSTRRAELALGTFCDSVEPYRDVRH